MAFRKILASISVGAMLLASAAPVIAETGGSGGGGSMPSASAPNFDPAKKYQEGVQLLNAKDYKKAEKAFDMVLDVAARDPNTNFMMAMAQLGQDDFKNARKFLRNTVKYKSDHVQGLGLLGSVEAKLGDTARAEEAKAALVALKGKGDAAQIDAAIARIDKALADPAGAIPLAGEMKRYASAAGDAAYLTAAGLINEGRYEQALGQLAEAGLVFGPHPDVLTYQGFANRKLGRSDVALTYYSAALKIDPQHRGANEYLGEYYVERGDLQKAKAQLGKLERICAFGCEEAEELRRWIGAAKS